MNEQSFGGPYVQVAAICTTPMIEQQGLLSVIRIQDRIQLLGQTDRLQPIPLQNLWLLICLKSGEMRGQQQLTITPNDPDGNALTEDMVLRFRFCGLLLDNPVLLRRRQPCGHSAIPPRRSGEKNLSANRLVMPIQSAHRW